MDGDLRKTFRQHLPRVDWQAIETAMTGGGVPDVNYCVDGFEGWIENKRSTGWAVKIRPEQIGWIERRLRHGGHILLAIRRQLPAGPRRGPAVDELWLFRGAAIRAIRDGGLNASKASDRHGVWDGGPGRWDWGAVLEAMKS